MDIRLKKTKQNNYISQTFTWPQPLLLYLAAFHFCLAAFQDKWSMSSPAVHQRRLTDARFGALRKDRTRHLWGCGDRSANKWSEESKWGWGGRGMREQTWKQGGRWGCGERWRKCESLITVRQIRRGNRFATSTRCWCFSLFNLKLTVFGAKCLCTWILFFKLSLSFWMMVFYSSPAMNWGLV